MRSYLYFLFLLVFTQSIYQSGQKANAANYYAPDQMEVIASKDENKSVLNDTLQDASLSYPGFLNGGFGQGRDSVCYGAQNVLFRIDSAVEDATYYIWTLNDSIINAVNDDLFQPISFPDTGVQTICVAAANTLDTTEFKCKTVEVLPLDTIVSNDTICEGEGYTWQGPFGDFVRQFPSHELVPGAHTYYSTTENSLSCSVPLALNLNVRDENDDTPTHIDTFVCFQWLPFIFYDHYILSESEDYSIAWVSPVTGCDTFFTVDLRVYGGHYKVFPKCNGKGGWIFTLNELSSRGTSTSLKKQLEIFKNSPDFSYEVKWMANRPSNVIGDSIELELSQTELEDLADNDILTLNAKILIYYKGELFCIPTIEGGIEFDINKMDYYLSKVVNILDEELKALNNAASGYQWLDCNSSFDRIPGETGQSYFPDKPGYYAVEIQFENCKDTSECVLFRGSTANSNPLINPLVTISPNPTSGKLTLQWKSELKNEEIDINIVDVNGELIKRIPKPNISREKMNLDLSDLPSGIYIMQLISEDKTISQKIVKQ